MYASLMFRPGLCSQEVPSNLQTREMNDLLLKDTARMAVLQVPQSHKPLHGYLLLPQKVGRREDGWFTTWDRSEYCMLVKV